MEHRIQPGRSNCDSYRAKAPGVRNESDPVTQQSGSNPSPPVACPQLNSECQQRRSNSPATASLPMPVAPAQPKHRFLAPRIYLRVKASYAIWPSAHAAVAHPGEVAAAIACIAGETAAFPFGYRRDRLGTSHSTRVLPSFTYMYPPERERLWRISSCPKSPHAMLGDGRNRHCRSCNFMPVPSSC